MAERRTAKPRKKKPTGPAGRGEPTVRKVIIEVIDPPPPSPLRGLLPTPRGVEEIVEQCFKERPAGPAYRLQTRENLKLQYYFGGHEVAYRETPQGYEVLAAGTNEVRRLVRKGSRDERRGVIFTVADLW
jgi:hypothetical protein